MGQSLRSTSRLTLRAPEGQDEESYRQLLLDPQVARWLRPAPLPALREPDPALWLARDIGDWARDGFGVWVASDRQTGAFVGRVGLARTTVNGISAIELAWALVPSHWGTGLASEAALEGLRFASELGIEEVVSFTTTENVASRRVMEKAGLQPIGEIQRAQLPHVLYRVKLAGSSEPSST